MSTESPSSIVLIGPAMETLFARSKDSLWPSRILNDPEMVRQADMRQNLYAKLCAAFDHMPDPTTEVAEALETGAVEEDAVAELFEQLAVFLDADSRHSRLVLYLPFELIPPKSWGHKSDMFGISSDRFMRSYMRCWRELLEESDVRANFVDGNILESELAPDGQPLVRKAAHLIPQLVQKGHLSGAEVTAFMDSASSDILRESVADALPALAARTAKPAHTAEQALGRDWLKTLPEEIAYELQKFDMREALDHSRGQPAARVAWERRNKEDLLVSAYATRIAEMIIADRIAPRDVLPLLSATQNTLRLAVIRGIGLAVEGLASIDSARARRMSEMFVNGFKTEWLSVSDVYDELEGILARWASLGVTTEAVLNKFGFDLPKLDVNFSTTSPLAAEIRGFSPAIELISRNPEYSQLLYPAAVFFGSRLKGYAKRNADLDAAVFVKPGIDKKERAKVRRILAKLFPSEKIDGKVVEFWLEEEGHGLRVRDFPDADVFQGDSTWVHLLMGSVWLGQDETVRGLYTKLLPGFLYSVGKTFMGRDIRTLRLEELEHEVLQYRLMHKGYRRFFPPAGGIGRGAKGLDPESAFWDSGYRRLATKLFVERVFLPQLIQKNNGQ